ncbi:hypothetical protein A9G42_03235 [Gilliamella sp. Nev6-6]|jgi:hypothetical protein|uniref:hypothetical protein n=1 Tax=Gilliamella sp. Nev6-6 TaxID=3120252 RepID=UPI00080F4E9D|nr:hypothetical protein [Gilliamella apicola]OCG78441.1 hypothetical protein A9G42_03235 [Gilliamella apicola]
MTYLKVNPEQHHAEKIEQFDYDPTGNLIKLCWVNIMEKGFPMLKKLKKLNLLILNWIIDQK